jgi:hypothetical protein
MHWLIIASLLLLSCPPAAAPSCCACLPKGIELKDVVGYSALKRKQAVTVAEKLSSLKARCKRGKLVDASGREIYFFQMTGCWGNPPEDYQQILDEQAAKLTQLKKRYTVIEMTCNPSGMLIP